MKIKISYLSIIFFLIINSKLDAQNKSDDGNVWNSFYFLDSKYNYLSSLIERIKIEKKLGINNSLPCNIFFTEKPSGKYSLSKAITIMDNYYSERTNLKTPIIYAYCFSILKLKGVRDEGLNAYEEYLMKKFKD